jgi:pimeloyl-ACP methyl ester carboxylesterase
MNWRLFCGVVVAVVGVRQATFAQEVPRLPEPSGAFGIGRVGYDWTDTTRPDPFSTNLDTRRELMVYVWYPTPSEQRTDAGVYVPGAKQIDAAGGISRFTQSPVWPLILSGAITSHAREGTPLLRSQQRLPVVLFSHGDSESSFAYTTAIEDLVSHGYVVASVEHPYSSSAVVFSDGRVVRFSDRRVLTGDRPARLPYFQGVEAAMVEMRQRAEIQASDLLFVLDRLRSLNDADRPSVFRGRLDFGRLVAVGHSLGGATAIRACQRDARIKACVSLDDATPDGVFLQYSGAKPLVQPLMFVEATPPLTFTDQQLAERGITRAEWTENANKVAKTQEAQLRGGLAGSYKVVLRAPGMGHGSFGDTPLTARTPAARLQALHNLTLTTTITRAFLDKMLIDANAALLEELGSPEVQILKYEPSNK